MSKKNKKTSLFDIFKYKPNTEYYFTLPEKDIKAENDISSDDTNNIMPFEDTEKKVSSILNENLNFIKASYNFLINSDIKIREFYLNIRNRQFKAFIVFIDGMVQSTSINHFILKPLMLKNKSNCSTSSIEEVSSNSKNDSIKIQTKNNFNLEDYIYQTLIPQNDVSKIYNFTDIFASINSGSCALFIDTISTCFVQDVKGFEKRSVAPPETESVIRGPQEAFIEAIRTNTSLLRRGVNNENLIIEDISIGEVSKTRCAICYIKDIANNELVAEVKYRLNNLSIDYLLSSGQLEQLILDNPSSSIPQILATERPDTSCTCLLEGRVVVLVNGSPYALIMPATLFDFMSSVEDNNLNYKFANLLKIIRFFALLITLFLPGFYIAITTFHQELIPTELLFSIAAARSGVPFPIIVEIFFMELSFELIREAGLRVPSSVGSTIGIIRWTCFRRSSCKRQYC